MKIQLILQLVIASFPSWERGLKLRRSCHNLKRSLVVPLVGTWIETYVFWHFIQFFWSFPSWERGLKQDCRGCNRGLD